MGEDAIIVAIVFGSILGMIAIPMLISLAKKWVERNNTSYDDEKFERLAKAFISHKKDMERRIQNLEAIISEEEPASPASAGKQNPKLEAKEHSPIEIDTDEDSGEKQYESKDGNLRNMLKE